MLEELRRAVASGDGGAVERAAHALKGIASHFAVTEVMHAAQQLEILGRDGNLHEAPAALLALEQALDHCLAALEE